jgi:serine/threonine protein kinase/tetratricopeptide (TPR) repeat protein
LIRAEKIQDIFDKAADLPPDQVPSLLDRECADDPGLRKEVESLLRSLGRAGRFLAAPTHESSGNTGPTILPTPSAAQLREGPGARIGPYKLLELIGEGGFGSVFMAEQEHPVRRRVALKIIKLGMDTRQVVARFEQERQALAMMEHSNIARVYDAGATETGRPYFVMELVKGDPIVAYCDRNSLSIPERLELFAQVCAAVQHAHTKGVIHRDLKPSNILVSTQDGRPNAKIIDFGIAKATGAQLTDKTLFTEHRALVGTPEYMSPEQAEGSLDIDTRTDVYSLGVLLYELLTGTTPFSGKELRSAAYAEIQRIIREVEPPRPSTRITRSSKTLASVAAQRRTQPAKLGAIIRGELDWVVMKALEKDRARRYESPSSLEADVRRYLSGEAVLAAPPGNAYRLRKFILRHKGAVSAVAAVLLALILGLVGFAWQARIATHQRDAADHARAEAKQRADELQQVAEFQARMLGQVDAAAAGDQLWTDLRDRLSKALEKSDVPATDRASRTAAFARELGEINATDTAASMLDRMILTPSIKEIDEKFKDQPAVDAQLRFSVALIYHNLGLDAKSLPLTIASAETFERLHGKDQKGAIESRALQALILENSGHLDEAAVIARDVLDRCTRLYGPDHKETLNAMSNLGNVLRAQRKFAEAEPLLKGALDGRRRILGNTDRETLISLNTYGFLLISQGKLAETEPYWREAYETGKKTFGPNNPDVLVWATNMGGLLTEMGKFDEAAAIERDAVEGFRKTLGAEHPSTLSSLQGLGRTLTLQGKPEEAEKVLSEVLEAERRTLGKEHPDTLDTLSKVGALLRDEGRFNESEAALREAFETSRRTQGADNADTLMFAGMLAATLTEEEKFAESNTIYKERLAAAEKVFGKEHLIYLAAARSYADSLILQNRLDEAEPLVREVIQTRTRLHGRNHPETIYANLSLASLLRSQGKLAESEALIIQNLDALRGIYKGDHPVIASALSALGDVHLKQGKAADAEPLFVQSLEMRRRIYSRDHPAIARSLTGLASAREALGRPAEARQGYEEAAAMYRRLYPEGSGRLAGVLWRLGKLQMTTSDSGAPGDPAAALPVLEQAVALAEKYYTPDHPDVVQARAALAECRAKLNQ